MADCAAPSSSLLSCRVPGTGAGRVGAAPSLSGLPRAPAAADERAWQAVADSFLIRPGLAYMNTGTRGPAPRYVHARQLEAIAGVDTDDFGYRSSDVGGQGEGLPQYRTALRRRLARFLGAAEGEVALMNNTTDGMLAGTWGPALAPGDEIVYTNHDHSSGAHPILLRAARDGLEVRVIDVSARRGFAGVPDYDVSHDGERMVMVRERQGSGGGEIRLVLNWFDELRAAQPPEDGR